MSSFQISILFRDAADFEDRVPLGAAIKTQLLNFIKYVPVYKSISKINKRFLDLTHPWRPRGSQSGRVKRRDERFQAWAEELFRLCLKTFVAPFLPARLTAPGSPRMDLTKIRAVLQSKINRMKRVMFIDFQLRQQQQQNQVVFESVIVGEFTFITD